MLDSKILWFDTETTGLSEYKHDIIQLAGLIEVNGVVLEEFNFMCQPHDFTTMEPKATAVHGFTEEFLQACDPPLKMWNKFCRILDSAVDRFDKNDKLIMAGFNTKFDSGFLQQFWKKCGQGYFGSYFKDYYKPFDVYPLAFMFAENYGWDVPNHKLETMCQFLDIKINAHDALSDVKATRDLYYMLKNALPSQWVPNR